MLQHDNTKERYLFEALKLFGERGFRSVRTSDIAKAVGCVPSALYKHYKSKQQLFDAILAESIKGYDSAIQNLQIDFSRHPEMKEKYLSMTEEEQIRIAKEMLLYPLHDEWACAFRKLMMVEQFQMKELAQLYDERYINLQYEQHAALFQMYMENGKMRKADSYTLAVMYISPINIMIGVCDRNPDKEEWALQVIEKHVVEFNRNYRL